MSSVLYSGGAFASGTQIVAFGIDACLGNVGLDGTQAVGVGYRACGAMVGINNVAVGCLAAATNFIDRTVAVGSGALASASTGAANPGHVCIGYKAGQLFSASNINGSTLIGSLAAQNIVTNNSGLVAGYASTWTDTNITNANCIIVGANNLVPDTAPIKSTVIGGNNTRSANNSVVIGNNIGPSASTARLALGSSAYPLTTTTSATTGAAGAMPAQVKGYLRVDLNGTEVKIPYFSV